MFSLNVDARPLIRANVNGFHLADVSIIHLLMTSAGQPRLFERCTSSRTKISTQHSCTVIIIMIRIIIFIYNNNDTNDNQQMISAAVYMMKLEHLDVAAVWFGSIPEVFMGLI